MTSLAPGQPVSTATDKPDSGSPPPRTLARDRVIAALSRFKGSDLDLRNTWQVVAGAILLPLGIAVIVLGWSGAAHGRVEQQQIPYLISGGLLGLALVLIGCFFYWAHWLYRIYDQADLHRQAALEEHNELLRALLQALGQRPAFVDDPAASAGPAAAAMFVATPSGTNFHLPGCPIVAGRVTTLRSVTVAEAADMRACRICEPSTASAD